MSFTNINSAEKKLLGLALLIHLITAYFSNGFYHWDEHFQIFEFANYKLGFISANHLPWEFSSKMRPFLIPSIVTMIGKIINDPFVISGLMRLFAMVLSFGACFVFYQKTKDEFHSEIHPIYLFSSFLLWFLPYLHVRVSAEIIGGALFILGYCLSDQKKSSALFLTGLLFGLGFWIRFQMGFALLGLGIGFLLNKKYILREILTMGSGFFLAMGINVLIDSWGYGQFTFAPWQYLHENIILGKAKHFGVNPLSDYFKWILNKPGFPIGLLFYLGLISQIKNSLKHPLTFTVILFLLAHFLVSHKEIRFLFPMIFLFPYFGIKFLSNSFPKIFKSKIFKYSFLILNLIPLMYLMNSAAHPSANFFKYITSNNFNIRTLNILGHTDPYKLVGLDVRFYQKKAPQRIFNNSSQDGYVFSDRVKYARNLENKKCELLYTSNKFLSYNLNSSYLKQNKRLWTLYKCQN
jgi:GPI mannosyltransferase 3